MTTYRVQNESDGKAVGTADSPDGVLEVVEKAGPGYYDIEEFNADSRPSGSIAQHWGKAIHIQDDGVTFETHHGERYTKKSSCCQLESAALHRINPSGTWEGRSPLDGQGIYTHFGIIKRAC